MFALVRSIIVYGLTALTVVIPGYVMAQNFGGVPPGKSWSVKGNDKIKVIYNRNATDIADSVLSLVDWINYYDPYSLGDRREKVKIVLRNENLTANGFVGYIPFRSEFYLYGAQDPNILGYSDWIRLLTLHEYRHVIQYSNLRWGISRFARDIFGDAAQAGLFNLLVPDWFSEGDAVFFESVVTGSGRGQLPAFSADFRALLLADRKYSYGKYRNGSYKDFVPNKYVHGYMLTGYGYHHYSNTFWQDVMGQTSRLKGLILPFKKAIKRNSGLKLNQFHNAMMDEYQQYLFNITDTTTPQHFALLPESDDIKNEIQILVDSSGQKYLLESSYDEISQVYKISGNQKKKVFSLGRSVDPYLILRDSKIYFTNRKVDSRWTNREFSDIYYYDLASEKIFRVTKNKKYLSIDYQPNTERYLAVQAGENGINTLVTFRKGSDIIDTLLNDVNTYYSYPHWLDATSDEFIYTGRKQGRMFLGLHDISYGKSQDLIKPTKETISRPFVTSSGIYFSSSRSGIDNIYCYNLNTKQINSITNDVVGAYNPTVVQSIDKDSDPENAELYYSAKTAYGNRINTMPITTDFSGIRSNISTSEWKPLFIDQSSERLIEEMPLEDLVQHKEKRYKPVHHLIHFHSLYLDLATTIPRLSLLSNDYLNTTKTSLYGSYYNSDQSFELGGEMTYAAWYPELFLNVNHRFNRRLNIQIDNDIIQIPKSETSMNVGMAIPLNFSRRQKTQLLRFTGKYGWTQEHFDLEDPRLPARININPRLFQTGLFNVDWTLEQLKAYRDIFPKWGVTGSLLAKRSFSPDESWLLYAQQGYNFPGLFQNDGFKLRWQLQHNSLMANNLLPNELKTSNNINYDYSSFRTGGLVTLNYLFPVAYPEVYIPHIIYTKRIAVNLFTEHFTSNTQHFTWTGMDLFLTARYFNLFDFTAGIRISRNWDKSPKPFSWNAVFLQDL